MNLYVAVVLVICSIPFGYWLAYQDQKAHDNVRAYLKEMQEFMKDIRKGL